MSELVIEQDQNYEATTSKTPTQSEAAASAPEAPIEPELPPIDPLTTLVFEPSAEELMFRQRSEAHRRLSRRHKPVITVERAVELEARMTETVKLREELKRAENQLLSLRASLERAGKADTDSVAVNVQTHIAELEGAIKDLKDQTARRDLTYTQRIQLFYFKANGLLTDRDLENLRAADAKRAKRAKRASEHMEQHGVA